MTLNSESRFPSFQPWLYIQSPDFAYFRPWTLNLEYDSEFTAQPQNAFLLEKPKLGVYISTMSRSSSLALALADTNAQLIFFKSGRTSSASAGPHLRELTITSVWLGGIFTLIWNFDSILTLILIKNCLSENNYQLYGDKVLGMGLGVLGGYGGRKITGGGTNKRGQTRLLIDQLTNQKTKIVGCKLRLIPYYFRFGPFQSAWLFW